VNRVLAALRSASPRELEDLCNSRVFRMLCATCEELRRDDEDDDDAGFDDAELGIPPE